MKLLIIGCGSIGRRHALNLVAQGVSELILCDPDIERARNLAAELAADCRVLGDYREALVEPDAKPVAAIVSSPTSLHLLMSLDLASAGVNIFMEKPLANNLNDIDKLRVLIGKNNIIFMMGMCYRFNQGLLRVKAMLDTGKIGRIYHVNYFTGQYLPDWHPEADYRREYSARSELGGGVILTSAIHMLDNIRWMFGEAVTVSAFNGKLSDLDIDVEDYVGALLILKDGVHVFAQADYLRRNREHKMFIAGALGDIEADFIRNKIVVRKDNGEEETTEYKSNANQMYSDEMAAFLKAIVSDSRPVVDIEEGIKSLELVMAVKESSVAKAFIDPGA